MFVDIAIPSNVRDYRSSLVVASRTVPRLKGGSLSVMPDLFFYCEPGG